jgi:dipeptidyl aminopeptidase/acylaminoacyl peptidase
MRFWAPRALFASLLIAAPAPLAAQDYAEQVWSQLQEAYHGVLQDENYALRNYILGSMNQGATDRWTFWFDQANEYSITGACDEDCPDLDIVIEDANGNVVASDEASDDFPVVFFSPGGSGNYTVNVRMYTCTEEPCYFGFGVFSR